MQSQSFQRPKPEKLHWTQVPEWERLRTLPPAVWFRSCFRHSSSSVVGAYVHTAGFLLRFQGANLQCRTMSDIESFFEWPHLDSPNIFRLDFVGQFKENTTLRHIAQIFDLCQLNCEPTQVTHIVALVKSTAIMSSLSGDSAPPDLHTPTPRDCYS